MFGGIRKAILTRIVTGILITTLGVHTGFRDHNGPLQPCMPHGRRMRGKNIYEKNKK
jgi:hypothetical protein